MIERSNAGPDGSIAVLRLASGPVNALDLELCKELTEKLHEVASGSARAVVMTGTGSCFSAGVDLRRLIDGGRPYVAEFLDALSEVFRTAFALPKPVIAALNGHAIAGGCVLSSAADLAVMAEGRGRVGVPELHVGVPFPHIALEILFDKVGRTTTRELVIGAETYPPVRARSLGLVDEIVDQAQVHDRAVELATELGTAIPADTFAVTRKQLRGEALARNAEADESGLADIWCRRIEDGWTARYLADTIGH